ncbi:alphaK I9 [Puccinia graminis f. sp. tritici CRL 75-36-700-3]|uniref:AlphaK I9 n=2 Tax=Puccinia graminis f. sp. tritici TaxID=56615 RepID=E3KES3_PUCGT|nr:alphaK I9 [Puccinia graminis f. sp. tritici CRL 75-36-700-3]EFP82777.2 alphaK I9 [Puccinia graminis f. sp. tritici CRL 75-36-700-3]
MSLCTKCNTWSDRGTFGDFCFECIKASGMNVDKMMLFFSNQPTPVPPRLDPPATHQHQSSLSSLSNRRHQAENQSNPGFASHPATNMSNPAPHPAQISTTRPSSQPSISTSRSSTAQPTYADFQRMTTEKRVKPATRISRILVKIDLKNARLLDDLRRQLWEFFSAELLNKGKVLTLATNPEDCTHLQVGLTRIRDLDILTDLAKPSTLKKPVAIDLMYENPIEDCATNLRTDTSYYPTSAPTERRVLRSASKAVTHPSKSSSNPSAWALGGVAGTVVRGEGNLSQKLACLGQPVSYSIKINPEGWTVGQRMVFHTSNIDPIPASSQRVMLRGLQHLRATSHPITLRVHDEEEKNKIGQGSMRIAYPAQVKVIDEDGTEKITEWVAKVRINDITPTLNPHATDALMHEACGLLLQEFKKALENCQRLSWALKKKGSGIQLVRHAVVITGDPEWPNKVYFLEKRLIGPYVKYSSNVNFNVNLNQIGMDEQLFWLMNAFTHWSYLHSQGQSLVCDLQGVGPILTDPQIIDLDNSRWADGNNSLKGIKQFITNHKCFTVCTSLGFSQPVDLRWRKGVSVHLPETGQPSANMACSTETHVTAPRLVPSPDIIIQHPPATRHPQSLAHLLGTAPSTSLPNAEELLAGNNSISTTQDGAPENTSNEL